MDDAIRNLKIKENKMKHYILVHGAWEGSWSWDKTSPVLEDNGHKVTAVDLPGSPGNKKDISDVTLESYVQEVVDVIDSLDEKVILVGHSMAGAIISQVAERIPENLEKLIYVTAFMMKNDDSVIEVMQRDSGGEFLPELIFSQDHSYATAEAATWRSKAFHDVDAQSISEVLSLVDGLAQATEPFMVKTAVTAQNFGAVPKVYIRTIFDKMLSVEMQDELIAEWEVDEVHSLPSGHFPTLSMPEKLARLML